MNELDQDELNYLLKFIEENPEFLQKYLQNQEDYDGGELKRDRRRISVFKNIYHQCRVENKKDKDYCLQIANLYQNVKGFHGI
jgi:hypothetical protein